MTRRAFTSEQDKEVVRLYLNGYSTHKIAKIYNCEKSAVSNALKREGISCRTNRDLADSEEVQILNIYYAGFAPRRIARAYGRSEQLIKNALTRQRAKFRDDRFNFCEAEEKEIVKIYLAGYSIIQIARAYSCLHKTIRATLKRQDVEIRKIIAKPRILKGKQPAKNLIKNELVFDNLDNETSLYWLGFCYADTDTNKYQLRIGLAIKDKEQVERLSLFLGCNPDNIRTNQISCATEFTSRHLSARLQALGIFPRRGEFWRIANEIPEGLESHFIRGYLDGDGCISNREKVLFLGQLDILMWIRDCLMKYAQASNRPLPYQRRGIMEIDYGGYNQFRRIVDYIYKDATIFLKRKREIADKAKRE